MTSKYFQPFPNGVENPDGRSLFTASYLLERGGYTYLAAEIKRMAVSALQVQPQRTAITVSDHPIPLLARIRFAFNLIFKKP